MFTILHVVVTSVAACVSAAALMVSASPIARVIANFISRYGSSPFPTRLFGDEAEAIQWLWERREVPSIVDAAGGGD